MRNPSIFLMLFIFILILGIVIPVGVDKKQEEKLEKQRLNETITALQYSDMQFAKNVVQTFNADRDYLDNISKSNQIEHNIFFQWINQIQNVQDNAEQYKPYADCTMIKEVNNTEYQMICKIK